MDAASAALLGAVLDALPAHPWLILLDPPRRAAGAAPPPGAGPGVALALGPLAPAEARWRSPQHVTEDTPLPPPVLARAAERRGGNPQFLRDLLAAAAAGDDALTETLEAAATARIDRLDPRDRTLVRHAAVLGHELPPAHAPSDGDVAADARLGRRRSSPTTAAAGCASAARSCARPPTPGCRSGRAAGCTPTRARGWRPSGSGAPASAAASSRCTSSAPATTGAPGATRARRRSARARRARTPTPRCCSGARSTPREAPAPPPRRRRGHLGRARRGAGAQRQPDAAQRAYRRARALAAGDALRAGEVLLRQTAARRPRRPRAAGDALRACARCGRSRTCPATRPRGCRARVLAALAMTRQRQGRSEEAIALCAQAIAEGERRGEDRAVAHACHVLDWALHDAGRPRRPRTPRARSRSTSGSATSTARRRCSTTSARSPSTPATGARRSCSTAAPRTRARRPATS